MGGRSGALKPGGPLLLDHQPVERDAWFNRERQAAFLQLLGDPRQLDVDDLGHLGAAQPTEDLFAGSSVWG
jgi:hypothetical protein